MTDRYAKIKTDRLRAALGPSEIRIAFRSLEAAVKILHTADFHLKEYGDDRWMTLQRLIELGKKESVEIFVVSGDLFDKGINAENLRPKIREVFSNTGFRIVLIPGNHDKDSYRSEMWFGEDVVILTNLKVPFEYQAVRIWGMPFEPIEGERVFHNLRSIEDKLSTAKRNILLYHGELLDASFSRGDFGDEGEERYMPVKLSYFKDLKIDYVLAGHFHSHANSWKLGNGGYFVYPGSPISITRREIGQRKANIFETGQPPKEYLLDTPHFEEIVIEFDPFRDKKPIEIVKERFRDLHKEARIILNVRGFLDGKVIGMEEKELVEKIKRIAAERCAVECYEFKDVQVILEDDLAKRFMEKLEQTGYGEETKKELRDTALRAMMDIRR